MPHEQRDDKDTIEARILDSRKKSRLTTYIHLCVAVIAGLPTASHRKKTRSSLPYV